MPANEAFGIAPDMMAFARKPQPGRAARAITPDPSAC